MSTVINWNVSQLDCLPQSAEGADYVVTAHWQCNGVDGDYSGSVYSTCSFPVVQGESFVPYADLTLDTVLVKAIQEQQAIITALTARVAALEAA